jgi:hypothetical protein
MPALKWDITDFIECLEVLPNTEESGQVHFEVNRDGLALKVCVRPLDSIIDVALHRSGSEDPLIGLRLFVRGRVEFRKVKDAEYLWIHSADPVPGWFSRFDYYEESIKQSSVRAYTVVLRVNPDIRIGFEYEKD